MRVVVTGGTGFVGARVVARLNALGHEVTLVVRPGQRRPAPACARIVVCDLEDFDVRLLPAGQDAVVALAQSEHFRAFPERALSVFSVNVEANLRLLEWAMRTGVRAFVMASSGGIYGSRARPFVEETDLLAVDSPLGFYLGSKLCAEVVFQNYRQFFATAVILRPFFIYGPGQRGDMLVPRLIDSVRAGRPVQLQGSEGLKINPVYVEDAADAFVAALSVSGCHVLNVAGPEVVSLRQLCVEVGQRLGRSPVFEQVPGDPSDYVANVTAASSLLGPATTTVRAGLDATTGRGEA